MAGKKYFYTLGLLFLVTILMVACGGKGEEKKSKNQASISFKVAGQYPPDHPESKSLVEFKEEVERETNGEVEIQVFPANQLGDYTQVYEEVMQGTIEMALIDVPSDYDSGLELNYLHYLATDFNEAREVFGSESIVYNALSELHENLGVKFHGFSAGGFGGVISMGELDNPSDPLIKKGGQTRVPTMSPFRISAEDMGFNPVSLPFAELYTSLQTGLVDSAIGANAVDTYIGYADIAKYYYLYNNFFQATSFVMNLDSWEQLDKTHQEVITEAVFNLSEKSFDVAEESDKEYVQKMIDEGIEVIDFTKDELNEFAVYAKEVTWPKLKDKLGEEVINELLSN